MEIVASMLSWYIYSYVFHVYRVMCSLWIRKNQMTGIKYMWENEFLCEWVKTLVKDKLDKFGKHTREEESPTTN